VFGLNHIGHVAAHLGDDPLDAICPVRELRAHPIKAAADRSPALLDPAAEPA
jgi:hypothetical protein